MAPLERADYERAVEGVRARLGEKACSRACSDGLTQREMDVLRLLAQGLTSAQIAERLVIGLITVNSHVRSICSKLGSPRALLRLAMP